MTKHPHGTATAETDARGLVAALRPGGRLLIVDFSPAPNRGPPASIRVAPSTVIEGLEGPGLSPIAPPDQYIVEARRHALSTSRPSPKQEPPRD